MPRSTQPRVCAAPPVDSDEAVKSISCRPSLYCCDDALQPLNGSTTSPLVASIVNALNVPAAGVQAHPSPNVDVPSSAGAAGLVTSRYFSDTDSLLLE